MATQGFEFAYSLDGSVPVVRHMKVSGTGSYGVGDLVVATTDGTLEKAVNSVAMVAAVLQEKRDTGTNGQYMKVALITNQQVWRCSYNGATHSASIGTRTQDITSARQLASTYATTGSLVVLDVVDDPHDTNPIGYVVFSNVQFG